VVVASAGPYTLYKSAPRCRQITTPAPQHSVFTRRMLFMPPNQQRQSTEGNDSIREFDIFARSNSAQLLLHGCSAADVSLAFAALPSLVRCTNRPFGRQRSCTKGLAVFRGRLSSRQLFGGAAGRLPAGRASEYAGERARERSRETNR